MHGLMTWHPYHASSNLEATSAFHAGLTSRPCMLTSHIRPRAGLTNLFQAFMYLTLLSWPLTAFPGSIVSLACMAFVVLGMTAAQQHWRLLTWRILAVPCLAVLLIFQVLNTSLGLSPLLPKLDPPQPQTITPTISWLKLAISDCSSRYNASQQGVQIYSTLCLTCYSCYRQHSQPEGPHSSRNIMGHDRVMDTMQGAVALHAWNIVTRMRAPIVCLVSGACDMCVRV